MRNILYITDKYYKEMGGSYEAIGSTVYNLKKDNFDIKFVYFNNGETNFNLDLVKIINKVDIVHFFGIWTLNHIKTSLLSIFKKKRFIITPMGALEPWSLSQKNLKKRIALLVYQKKILRLADVVHCTSIDEEKNIKLIDENINTKIIPHSATGLNYEKREMRKDDKIKFLFFSRIHKKKGLDLLIQSWKELRPKNCELNIYGPDGDGTKLKLQNEVIKSNLTNQIIFHEPVFKLKEKNEIYKKHDISILFSRNENFSYTILESLQHSLPVFTNTNVPWKAIRDTNAGWYIQDDYEYLKKTLSDVFKITKKDLLIKSKNAFNLSRNYDWKIIGNEYRKLYKIL